MHAKQQRSEEAAQHTALKRDQRKDVQYLEDVVKTEVQANKEANATLRVATEGQVELKGEVPDLAVQLQATLDQIHKLLVDLATTRSLLEAGGRPRQQQPQQPQQQNHDDGGASTSNGQKWVKLETVLDTHMKGKKTPSLADNDRVPSSMGSGKAPSKGRSISLRGAGDDRPSSSSSSEDGSRDVPRSWRFLR